MKRQSVEQRIRGSKNYNIYGINTHGSGLNSIRNEFVRQVGTGRRRHVFVIDVQEIQSFLEKQANTSPSKHSNDNKHNSHNQLINIVLQNIEDLRKAYDATSRRIAEELKFDLYQYWLKNLEDKLVESLVDTASLRGKPSATLSAVTNARRNRASLKHSKKSAARPSASIEEEEICMELVRKEHNRVGQQEMLSRKKYIKDEPAGEKLYFILLGPMNEQFYADLIRRDQPVQGIINFIPSESKYDLLINNNKIRNFIQQSLHSISQSVLQFRQEVNLKAVGLFTHNLPVISECLARKYQNDIYDQLTWSVYDIEVLQQQYYNYYYMPFRETDVKLPADVDLRKLQDVAASLSLRGHFQLNEYAGGSSDTATILAYLDSLLNTCARPEKVLNKTEIFLLSMTDYGLPKSNPVIRQLIEENVGAFSSITKVRKFQRLFAEESNRMMVNVFQHTDQHMFRNIYLACLDYKLWRELVTSFRPKATMVNNSSATAPIELPGYVKLYTTGVSCAQRITELNDIYNGFYVVDISPTCKLYTFRRTYNFVDEHETLNVIPTRLCFRDFTVFQMNEFYQNLMNLEKKSSTDLSRSTSAISGKKGGFNGKKSKALDFKDSLFIRLNSLKALKHLSEKESDQIITHRDKEQKSSRKRNSVNGRKSSSRISQDGVGLPSGHPLLKGYNLDDTRQEIKTKTSKYIFHHGKIQLSEEKWCFQGLNQTLKFDINNCCLHLHRPRLQQCGIQNNIRLTTKNNVTIRILNEPQECSKVVINYPNGLSIYYHDTYCEQVWIGECSRLEERRRVVTPYGAVVVFYQKDDVIMIMRYNGEIYRLYQYEEELGEEEQSMLSEFTNEQSSELMDNKGQGDSHKNQKLRNASDKDQNRGQGDSLTAKSQPPKPQQSSEESSTSASNSADLLRASIEFELLFFNLIASKYNLSYVHLKITTSQGKRVTITMDGRIYESSRLNLEEWHDYFANESYAQRNDRVKMIWSKDALKCYHKDGTVFTTKTDERINPLKEYEDGFEIIQSSSHQHIDEDEGTESLKASKRNSSEWKNFNFTEEGVEEEQEEEDRRFIEYSLVSMFIQHLQYAGVYFIWINKASPMESSVLMEISAVDNIFVLRSHEDENGLLYNDNTIERSSFYEEGLDEHNKKELSVTVSLDNNLFFTVYRDGFEIFAVMERFKADEGDALMGDSLTLRILFKDCLTDVFAYLQKEIAAFHNYNGPIEENIYFMELYENDCYSKGFEFISKLPEDMIYQYTVSNTMIQLKPLLNINETMAHPINEYETDMKKFPRFRCRTESDTTPEIPMVFTSSIYCTVPKLLKSTDQICKFLEPFTHIHFKSLRDKFKQFLDSHLRPQIQMDLKNLYSKKNWIKRKREHERRKFMETQRLGLYHAMLKHKQYPNYFKFSEDYRGNVSDIDFFEFMQFKCKDRDVPITEVYWKPAEWKATRTSKNKCLYGTYDDA